MSLLSGSELFEVGTTNGDGTGGALRTDSTSQVQPSASTASGDAGGVLRADGASRVRPSYTASGDATTAAAQADAALGVRPSSSANGDATTAAAQADSASRVRPSYPATGDGVGGVLRVALVDEVGLSDEGLRSRLKVLGRAESTLAAMKSRALAELSRRHNKRDAQRLIRDELQTSKRDAKRDVETATRLAELPATSGALNSGDIPVGHAQLIARAASESPINETLLVKAAGSEPFDEFMQTVKLHQRDVAADDGQGLLDRQRKKRKARIFESSDSGMFVLTGEFDQITGARIATALTAKERQLWHREDPNKRATPQQRMADALAELINEPTGDGRSVGTDLLVIADFDVLEQQLENPRLVDGSPIPITELHKMALEANLLPSIFDTKTQDMWLGRRVRTATEAQRIALIARDQQCIGCGANPLWCQAHHIIWWSKNGPTDLDNLVLVCNDCHHKIHDDGWQVHKHPKTGKYYLKPPTHLPTISSDVSTENSLGESPPHRSTAAPTLPSNERPTDAMGEHPTDAMAERPIRPSGQFPTDSSEKSATHSSEEQPTISSDVSTKNSLGESPPHRSTAPPTLPSNERPIRPSGQFPTVPSEEPSTHPSNARSAELSDKRSVRKLGERRVVSVGESLTRPSVERPAVLSDEHPTSLLGKRRVVSVGESLTRPSVERPTVLSDNPSARRSGERSDVSSDGVPTLSTGPPSRARSRADPARPDASDANQATLQNAPGLVYGEQDQRKKQTSSHTEQRHSTTRTTGHDPVDGTDTC